MTLTVDTITPDAQDQTAWVTFRLTPAERDELRDHAHAARISMSELVRRRVLGLPAPKAAVPGLNAKAYADLARAGGNLNQIAKQANESGQFGPTQLPIFAKVLNEFRNLIDQLRRDLIGADKAGENADS